MAGRPRLVLLMALGMAGRVRLVLLMALGMAGRVRVNWFIGVSMAGRVRPVSNGSIRAVRRRPRHRDGGGVF